ncbi:putative BOI-related E3 ubiquitin-protein ligase 3 isoform X1 [Canna indica]|uniref:BOI-related E3 ubiquitin-protein ligase 3 isoform X1 n=1 Tax=Canna indica TaxID=4628 RepID=A0AAQ3QN68_9LILI|nr:putative BOI-related E3 ubiquitin-protein ligase 3 isoform X1 [Canna indica]
MAVEAHLLHLFPSQLLRNREITSGIEDYQSSTYNMQLGFFAPAAGSLLPFCNSPASVTPAATSDSSLTFNNLPASMASRKRPRDSDRPLSFLGEDFSSHIQQQMLDADRLILQHVEKVRLEMMERLKRFLRRILAAVEEGLSKRLKAKDEEIDRMSKLNWALEERIKSLCMENQMWRDLAQSNEAAAEVLRTNLEQALAAAQVKAEEEAAAIAIDDVESCCCGDNNGVDEADKGRESNAIRRVCRCCRQREPTVLLLPCRHLCVCAACGPAIMACPICNCSKNGSVLVNMS